MKISQDLDVQLKRIAGEYRVNKNIAFRNKRYKSSCKLPLWAYIQKQKNGKTILDLEKSIFDFSEPNWHIASKFAKRIASKKNLTAHQMNLLSTILSNEMGRGTFDNSYFSFFGGFCDRKEKGLCQFDYYMERYETLQINQYLHNAIEEAETIKYQISMNFLFDERVTNIMLLKQLELALKKKIKTPTIQKELTQCTINK